MTTDRKPHVETTPELDLDEVAELVVRGLYCGLPDDVLRQMLVHGNEFEPAPVIVAMNGAIQNELDRRLREREKLEVHP